MEVLKKDKNITKIAVLYLEKIEKLNDLERSVFCNLLNLMSNPQVVVDKDKLDLSIHDFWNNPNRGVIK